MSNLSLDIAASALNAQQAGMDTIAQNLANANTPGYVAEGPVLTTNPPGDLLGVGTGVRVAGISQVPDQLAQTANQQAQGGLAQATALQQVLTQAQATFPEPNGQGLSTQLANFWSAWDAIAQNPGNQAPYTQVADMAQGLATSLNQASTQLSQTASNTTSQLTTMVSADNGLLSQIAQINTQIASVKGGGGSANSLIDQQNQLANQLASDLGATATTQPDGTMNVSIGGSTLVQGGTVDTLNVGTVTGSGGGTALGIINTANNAALSVTSGTAAGYLVAVNTYLPKYQSQLNTVAQALATTVDTQLASGYTTTAGTAGDPLFVQSGTSGAGATTTGITATNIAVNPSVTANPQNTLGVSSVSGSASNNAGNAQAMAELGTSATGPDQAYTSLIQGLGTDVQGVNNQVTSQTSLANAANQNLQEIAGVNTNQQMVTMLSYQHAYQAAAQVITVTNTMIQSLLQAV